MSQKKEKDSNSVANRFTVNLEPSVAKMLWELCAWEGRKKNQMLSVLVKEKHAKYKK